MVTIDRYSIAVIISDVLRSLLYITIKNRLSLSLQHYLVRLQ
nr:MAG TPA: hypothetical protein [Myoviridae sp. ctfuG5]DAO09494.1 MAG TPA: hypothetical protein [Caudoviricetes sp.]DAS64004.1 MAG TPA: hypothetical protein [Caudoviricetes sp.]